MVVEDQATGKARARVNGELVRRAPRHRPSERHYNPNIHWLLKHAAGELGEQGMAINPDGGGGGDMSDTWPLHESVHRSGPAVRRWRQLMAIWVELPRPVRHVLQLRYRDTERQHSEIVGLRATFGDLATLAWELGQYPEPSHAAKLLRSKVLAERRRRRLRADEAAAKWASVQAVASGGMGDHLRRYPDDRYCLVSAARHDLRSRLSRGSKDQRIKTLLCRAEAANAAAHQAWSDEEREQALDIKCPPRAR